MKWCIQLPSTIITRKIVATVLKKNFVNRAYLWLHNHLMLFGACFFSILKNPQGIFYYGPQQVNIGSQNNKHFPRHWKTAESTDKEFIRIWIGRLSLQHSKGYNYNTTHLQFLPCTCWHKSWLLLRHNLTTAHIRLIPSSLMLENHLHVSSFYQGQIFWSLDLKYLRTWIDSNDSTPNRSAWKLALEMNLEETKLLIRNQLQDWSHFCMRR